MNPRVASHQSVKAPTPEQTYGLARDARAWLVSLLDSIPVRGESAVRALCHVLVASWIADTVTGEERAESASFTEVSQRVAFSLNANENCDHIDCVKPT